jgi:Ran GTPase-activating protein (RanGAP) involved in mRNA processing and transport
VGCGRQPWPEQEGADLEQRTTVPDVEAAEAVARVAVSKPLRSLSLDGNYLGDNGVACLATILASKAAESGLSLESLNLANNNASAGAQQRTFGSASAAIGQLIAASTTLASLELCHNGIRDEGACAVAKGLRTNTSLLTLKLAWNSFGAGRPIKDLRNALVAASLTSLDLSYNSITAKTAHILAEALALNTTLRRLCVDGKPNPYTTPETLIPNPNAYSLTP